jgi:hypothetical protein
MKVPRYEVILRLHEDDNGLHGLCHDNAVGVFDAFWSADGVFHDVFEHYFEGQSPYFSGIYMHTIFGEMAASGAGIALRSLGIDSFRHRRATNGRDYTADTWYEVREALKEGCCNYPIDSTLCKVPWQSQPDNYNYSSWLSEYEYKLNSLYNNNPEIIRQLRFGSVRNCYAWGYKRVLKLIKDRDKAYDNLDAFLMYWNDITKQSARDIGIHDEYAYELRSFKFKVYDDFEVETVAIDAVRNEYPMDLVMAF